MMKQTLLKIYVQPAASVTQLVGPHGDRLKIKIKSPPQENEANAEVMSFLRKILGVKKNQIRMIRGEKSRQKDLLIELPPAEVSILLGWPVE
jgi:uncharacterized protein